MSRARTLSPGIVADLRRGDPRAVGELYRYTRSLASAQQSRSALRQESFEDVVQEALADTFASHLSRNDATPDSLAEFVRKAIRRHAVRTGREGGWLVNVDPKWFEGPTEEELDQGGLQPIVYPPDWYDLHEPTEPTPIYLRKIEPKIDSVISVDLLTVDKELIAYLNQHPEALYSLNPRRFEELVASLLKHMGYTVELTPTGPDGGVDILATQRSGIGEVLLLVDCKRYAPSRGVGVEIIRSLYGIGEARRATMSMLATTSYFTAPAQEFQRALHHRLTLRDYDDLVSWISSPRATSQ